MPAPITDWFSRRGWQLHPHQRAIFDRAEALAVLLIAPTGGGKTLAGFLPTLAELADGTHRGLHTLYISPLKALAADIRRNLTTPVTEMGLPIRIEDRSGDTSHSRRQRQRADPPHILLTTPESLALLLSYEDAPRIFTGLKRVIVDEVRPVRGPAGRPRPRPRHFHARDRHTAALGRRRRRLCHRRDPG